MILRTVSMCVNTFFVCACVLCRDHSHNYSITYSQVKCSYLFGCPHPRSFDILQFRVEFFLESLHHYLAGGSIAHVLCDLLPVSAEQLVALQHTVVLFRVEWNTREFRPSSICSKSTLFIQIHSIEWKGLLGAMLE